MADTKTINGEDYIHISYLTMANKTSVRRRERINILSDEIARLTAELEEAWELLDENSNWAMEHRHDCDSEYSIVPYDQECTCGLDDHDRRRVNFLDRTKPEESQ